MIYVCRCKPTVYVNKTNKSLCSRCPMKNPFIEVISTSVMDSWKSRSLCLQEAVLALGVSSVDFSKELERAFDVRKEAWLIVPRPPRFHGRGKWHQVHVSRTKTPWSTSIRINHDRRLNDLHAIEEINNKKINNGGFTIFPLFRLSSKFIFSKKKTVMS